VYPVPFPVGQLNQTVEIGGLLPLSNYSAYCYSEDTASPGNMMIDSAVADTRRNFSTRCCFTLTPPPLPSTLYATEVSAPIALISPLVGINVTISSRFFPSITPALCLPSTLNLSQGNASRSLRVSPQVLRFVRTTTTAFTVTTSRAGCYAVRYTVTGPRHSAFSLGAVYVLSPNTPKPAPMLSTARFSSSGSLLLATFTGATDQAGLKGVFVCTRLFAFTGASTALCSWTNPAQVTATLPSTATILPADNFTLLAASVRAQCEGGNGVDCTTWPTAPAGTVQVQKPRPQ
jgi:hypothetical protein